MLQPPRGGRRTPARRRPRTSAVPTPRTAAPVSPLDAAIARGRLPPVIIAAPDGSISGLSGTLRPGSFYINSPRGGRFQDYLEHDVWDFLVRHFPIRPEREAHALLGVSMGGLGAYNLALKRRDRFGAGNG